IRLHDPAARGNATAVSTRPYLPYGGRGRSPTAGRDRLEASAHLREPQKHDGGVFMSQRVLVTAGAGGIGLATAEAFLAQGDRVHIVDINAEAIESARAAH